MVWCHLYKIVKLRKRKLDEGMHLFCFILAPRTVPCTWWVLSNYLQNKLDIKTMEMMDTYILICGIKHVHGEWQILDSGSLWRGREGNGLGEGLTMYFKCLYFQTILKDNEMLKFDKAGWWVSQVFVIFILIVSISNIL